MLERTLAIIKPDAVALKHSGIIIGLIELNKFTIVRMQKMQLSKNQAEQFYEVHKERPFFGELVETMTTGAVIVMVLERDNAIVSWRELMGATDPQKAAVGTIRSMLATDIGRNAVHGSDSSENAQKELKFFFPDL